MKRFFSKKPSPPCTFSMITLQNHEIRGNIKDRYANIVYSFDFENMNEYESDELKFEITINPNAFISKFEARIDGELFVGKTKEKQTASKEYYAAKKKNENAILISQPHDNIPNVFEIKTNIDSKSKVLLTITIEQYLRKKFGLNELCVQILKNFDKYNIKTKIDYIEFKLNIEDKCGIHSVDIPTMNNEDIVIVEKSMDKMNTKCQLNGKIMAKSSVNELILKYKIKGEENDSYILFDSKSNTFCHVITDIINDSVIIDEKDVDEGQNEEIKSNNILIPRRVVFAIDRSGSMSGSKWNKTISSTIMALKQLRKGYDRFNIILFDSNINILPYNDMNECILADDKSISDSIQILQNKKIGGSTNINNALLKAIELIKSDTLSLNDDTINGKYNFFMNQMIFITDGQPNNGETDTKKIIMNVRNANDLSKIDKYNDKISIFSFGVGKDGNDSGWINDLNHSFLKVLSVNNNGFYHRIKQTSADVALSQYFNILSKPILSNINISYKNKDITDLTKTKFNTLYSGNDLIICGKIGNNKQNINDYNLSLSISAITGKAMKENNKSAITPINICKNITINLHSATKETEENVNICDRIWGYLKLQQYAQQKLMYNDIIEIDDDEKKECESLPLSLALKYKFVTPWTSMIVVKKKDNDDSDDKRKSQKSKKKDVSANIDKKTNELETKIETQERQILELKSKMQKSKGAAKNSYKQKALKILKQKKQYEQQRDQMVGQQFNIDNAKFAQQSIKDNADMVMAMKSAAAQIKTAQINIDEVEDLQDDMMDLMDDANEINEINEILGEEWGMDDFDEDDLLNELDGLDDELSDLDMMEDDIPSYMISANKNDLKGDQDAHVDEYGLPKVPDPIPINHPMNDNNNNNNNDDDVLCDLLGGMDGASSTKTQQEKSNDMDKKTPFEAYNSNGIVITFNFASGSGDGVCRVFATINNTNSYQIDDVSLMISVPKYIKLQIKPANGTKLLALSMNSITQKFQLTNTMYGQKPFTIGIQIICTVNGKQIKEKVEIELPDDCC